MEMRLKSYVVVDSHGETYQLFAYNVRGARIKWARLWGNKMDGNYAKHVITESEYRSIVIG